MLHLAPHCTIPLAALTFSASRSGGAGGQHVNKTETRVELRLPIAAISGLSPAMHLRLVDLAGSRLTAEGELLLVCDETRSRRRNQDLVIERLCELVREARAVPRPRRATKPTRGSVQRRLQAKAATSERKRDRRSGHDE
jgi:ribosome-associated protein